MDDIIDLELEKIDAIYDKIIADPEADEIKQVELNLWGKIKEKAINGRRTGIGITAKATCLPPSAYNMGQKMPSTSR